MKETKYSQVWNLDSLFPGGSQSIYFHNYLEELEITVNEFETSLKSFQLPTCKDDSAKVKYLIETLADIRMRLTQATSFITCLLAQNPKDQDATILRVKVAQKESRYEKELSKVKKLLLNTKEEIWDSILETEELTEYKFILNEWRENADKNLAKTELNLIQDLMVDGYHAWGNFYTSLVSSINVNIQINGK